MIRPEQFNFLFFEPAELRFSKIGKKKLKNPSRRKRKIKKGLGIFTFKRLFFCICAYFEMKFDRKPTWVHMRDGENRQ